MLTRQGSLHLLTFSGIAVFVHWTWFAAAFFLFTLTGGRDFFGFLAIYCSLFGIVLLHEFGHALACRSVGGRARDIVLWPLGGVAYVEPPPRPGAVLWSIAAGPLVNVGLLPVLYGLALSTSGAWQGYFALIAYVNLALLIFNLLPIYPLDGGQIVQSVLWFFVGRSRSLRLTAGFGFAVALVVGLLALLGVSDVVPVIRNVNPTMLLLLSAFIGWKAWQGYQVAKLMAAMEAYEQDGLQRALRRAAAMTREPMG
ncbi:MAG: site-2 protease family protein [Planctomycetota bacterium]